MADGAGRGAGVRALRGCPAGPSPRRRPRREQRPRAWRVEGGRLPGGREGQRRRPPSPGAVPPRRPSVRPARDPFPASRAPPRSPGRGQHPRRETLAPAAPPVCRLHSGARGLEGAQPAWGTATLSKGGGTRGPSCPRPAALWTPGSRPRRGVCPQGCGLGGRRQEGLPRARGAPVRGRWLRAGLRGVGSYRGRGNGGCGSGALGSGRGVLPAAGATCVWLRLGPRVRTRGSELGAAARSRPAPAAVTRAERGGAQTPVSGLYLPARGGCSRCLLAERPAGGEAPRPGCDARRRRPAGPPAARVPGERAPSGTRETR